MFDAGYEAVLLICPDSKIGTKNCKEKEGWIAVEIIISDFEMARAEPHFNGIYAYFCKLDLNTQSLLERYAQLYNLNRV